MISLGIEERDRNEFLTVLAHELRNPLASILSTVELMNAQGVTSEDTPNLLRVLDERVHAMALVLNQFLAASSVSKNEFPPSNEPTFVHKIPSPKTQPVTNPNALRILVVDDNETAADSLGQLLSQKGYHVEVAYNGESALIKASLLDPQVAILDIGMPHMDGYQLAKALQKNEYACTYIALTGYGQPQDKQQAQDAGIEYHFIKPTPFRDIEAILQVIATARHAIT